MSDGARTPDRRFRIDSEAEAAALVERARAYGAEHRDVFAGAWLDYIGGHPYVFAAFAGDLDVHRAALDPRFRLVAAARSSAELEATADAVRRFAETYPVESHFLDVDVEHQRLVLSVTVDDDAAFEREVREQFGSVVDVYFSLQGRRATPIDEWRVLADGRTVAASWTGGGGERDHRLEAEERDGEIHLTASCVTEVGIRRADGGDGPRITWGSTLEGYHRTASVTLSKPVGDRRILDDQRDRINDHPPVKRSWKQRRNEDMLGIKVWEWVDTLDWAQGQGCEGPMENGWIRIFATVDDTERLRAAIVEKFGPGFEVVYQAPYDPAEDED